MEILVELLVYAPIGVAVMAKEHLPALVESGRRQAETRVRVARMVGEFAVIFGRRELEKRMSSAAGTSPRPEAAPPLEREDPPPESAVVSGSVSGSAQVHELARRGPRVQPDDLAIPSYDSLAASQIVERLASLSPPELARVKTYESDNRHRRTVLHRIEQLAP